MKKTYLACISSSLPRIYFWYSQYLDAFFAYQSLYQFLVDTLLTKLTHPDAFSACHQKGSTMQKLVVRKVWKSCWWGEENVKSLSSLRRLWECNIFERHGTCQKHLVLRQVKTSWICYLLLSLFAGEKIASCAFSLSWKNAQMTELEEATLIFDAIASEGVPTMC